MTNTPKPVLPAIINRLRVDVPLGFAMLAGMQLDLFTALKDGPRTAEELAALLQVDASKLSAVLYALVLAELLSVAEGRFTNSPEAYEYLVQGRPGYLGHLHRVLTIMWDADRTTAESVRSGMAKSKIDWDNSPLEQVEAGLRSLLPGAMADGRALAARFDFSAARTVADVGGGSGGLALGLTEARPGVLATVIDLPRVASITRRIIADAGASGRVTVLPADAAHEPLPGRYDAVVLRNVLQVLSPADARGVILNAGHAVKPGGAIYIIGSILDDSRLSPPLDVAVNLFFLNAYDHGQSYTDRQHRDWLAEAGFAQITRELPPRVDIMSAHKPD